VASPSLLDGAVRVIYDELTDRRILQINREALGPAVSKRITDQEPKYREGGQYPTYLADYCLSLTAQPGDTIFKSFGEHNIGDVTPRPDIYPQVLSFDFGFAPDPTCILAGQITPTQVQIYYEHYLAGATARVHKSRLVQGLSQWPCFMASRGKRLTVGEVCSVPDNFFADFTAVGDPSGAGYKAEYAEPPWPIGIVHPSQDKGWRDREGSESIVDGLLRPLKRCCHRIWPDDMAKCDECKKPVKAMPGLLIGRNCRHLIEEFPAQVVDEMNRRPKGIPDHSVDAMLYFGRYALGMRVMKEPESKSRPWWLPALEAEVGDTEEKEFYGNNAAVVRFFR